MHLPQLAQNPAEPRAHVGRRVPRLGSDSSHPEVEVPSSREAPVAAPQVRARSGAEVGRGSAAITRSPEHLASRRPTSAAPLAIRARNCRVQSASGSEVGARHQQYSISDSPVSLSSSAPARTDGTSIASVNGAREIKYALRSLTQGHVLVGALPRLVFPTPPGPVSVSSRTPAESQRVCRNCFLSLAPDQRRCLERQAIARVGRPPAATTTEEWAFARGPEE